MVKTMDDDKILVEAINSCPLRRAVECPAEPCRLCARAAARIERLRADVARLEAESRAKEQYIAEHMGAFERGTGTHSFGGVRTVTLKSDYP